MIKPKIVFYGSDKYSQIVLAALKNDSRFQLVENPASADVGVLASYGKILSAQEITAPRLGILNIHPSLLPKYRGATPVPTAILNGETETGVSIIKLDEKVDHGPIVAQFNEEIRPTDTAGSLLFRLFGLGGQTITEILPAYLQGEIELRPQNHSRATYTKRFTRQDGQINWQKSPKYLNRFIRAMSPWPGAWTKIHLRGEICRHLGGVKRLKILKAHLENGKLVLDQVQLEGKKPVSFKQFCEGYPGVKINSLH